MSELPVRRLPHQLVEGFAATLEETLVADLVLHVADASAPEQRLDEMIAAVDSVLGEIGAGGLPVELVEGFAATLEETLVADLVLDVVDASVADDRLEEQAAAVTAVLYEIGADDLPVEIVVNKVDAVDVLRRRRLANRFPEAIQVSARTGQGLNELRERIAELFADRFEAVHLFLPYEDGGKLAELYELGAPIEEREDQADGVFLRARLPRRELRRFARYLVAGTQAEPARRAR